MPYPNDTPLGFLLQVVSATRTLYRSLQVSPGLFKAGHVDPSLSSLILQDQEHNEITREGGDPSSLELLGLPEREQTPVLTPTFV